MGEEREEGVSAAVAEAMERINVGETVESLRRQVDDLISQLASAEEAVAEEASQEIPRFPEKDLAVPDHGGRIRRGREDGLEAHIDSLGNKVDSATDMLAELTDILEAQAERIETIEQQLGDPDLAQLAPGAAVDPAQAERGEALDRDFRHSVLSVLKNLDAEIVSLGTRVGGLEGLAFRLKSMAEQNERGLQSLEDRMHILVGTLGTTRACDPVEEFRNSGPSRSGEEDADDGPSSLSEVGHPALPDFPLTEERDPSNSVRGLSAPEIERLAEEEIDRSTLSRHAVANEAAGGVVEGNAAQVRRSKGRRSVMIVDDSPDARTILSIFLSKTGYQVVTAASAEDCLSKLLHHDVDAVILDPNMPGADGGHVCRVIREDPAFENRRNVTVIVYSADRYRFDREKAMGWGADDYVVKGGDMLPLLSSLMRHCDSSAEASG
ncbi:MAG: PleD family two-component system response regulator [Candidatus Binatia bacterium]